MADSESAILHFIIFNLKSRLDKSPGSHLQIFSTYQERQTGLPDIASLIGINFSPRNRFSALIRSGKRGSNPRPSAWEANALPTELLPQFYLQFAIAIQLNTTSPIGIGVLCQMSYCRNSIYNLSIYNLQFTKSEMLSNNLPDAKITLLTDYLAFADPIFSVPVAFALTRVKQCDPRSLQTPSFLSM